MPGSTVARNLVLYVFYMSMLQCIPVFFSNAVIYPRTMVVESFHTFITLTTVFSSHRTNCLACMTQIIYWIVHIIIVTPCRGVTYLLREKFREKEVKSMLLV